MRLLLVEDSSDLGPRLKAGLERQEYAIDLAVDGASAELQADTVTYDAVILDLGLPGRDGLTVLKNWRRRGNHVPVIILTAHGEWHEKVDGLKAGADDYLSKPFRLEELLARLQAVMRRTWGSAGPRVEVEGLTLDEDAQQVIRADGRRIALTAAEFRLLRYMMLHHGRILSKESLFDHIYGFEGEAESNVIEVYINRLRAKLGRHLINTRRGQGYVLGRGRT
jgi:DNA-binding response OmpR family regulator